MKMPGFPSGPARQPGGGLDEGSGSTILLDSPAFRAIIWLLRVQTEISWFHSTNARAVHAGASQ